MKTARTNVVAALNLPTSHYHHKTRWLTSRPDRKILRKPDLNTTTRQMDFVSSDDANGAVGFFLIVEHS